MFLFGTVIIYHKSNSSLSCVEPIWIWDVPYIDRENNPFYNREKFHQRIISPIESQSRSSCTDLLCFVKRLLSDHSLNHHLNRESEL